MILSPNLFKTSMFSCSKFVLLFVVIQVFTFQGKAQNCKNNYVNNKFGLEICNKDKWEIKEDNQYLKFKKENIVISVFAEQSDDTASVKSTLKAINEKPRYKKLEIIKEESVKVDGINTLYSIAHAPYLTKEAGDQRDVYSLNSVVLFNGLKYTFNTDCYTAFYKVSEERLLKLLTQIKLINPLKDSLTKVDKDSLNIFGNRLFQSIKSNNVAALKGILIAPEKIKNAYSVYLRDEDMKQKQLAAADENWNSVLARNVKVSETQLLSINKKGLDVGIDWSKAVLESFSFEARYKTLDIKSVNAKLSFKYNNRRFLVLIRDIMLCPDGWYITEMTKGLQEVD